MQALNRFKYFLYFVISFTVFIKHLCVYMFVWFMIDKIVTCMDQKMSPKDFSTINYFCKSSFCWDRLIMNWVDDTFIQSLPTALFSSSMFYQTIKLTKTFMISTPIPFIIDVRTGNSWIQLTPSKTNTNNRVTSCWSSYRVGWIYFKKDSLPFSFG